MSSIGFDAVPGNAADFSRSLMALADHAGDLYIKVVRKSLIDLYRAIVEKTPVDTGRAKASWGISTIHVSGVKDDSGEYTLNEIDQIVRNNISGFRLSIRDDEVVIYNNLEYIEPLEDGTSTQAPTGMVSISLVEFETFFNNALRGIEGAEAT